MLIVLHVQMVKMMLGGIDMNHCDLQEAVMQLHTVARTLERELGHGELSRDIRKNADRLHNLCVTIKTTEAHHAAY